MRETRNRYLFASIGLLFLLLWMPMGQHDFLVNHWMKIGVYAIPFLGMGIFAFRINGESDKFYEDFRFLGVAMLVIYIAHQFEEHWIDLYGNTYAFHSFNNNFILDKLGEPSSTIQPLTKESVFVINTSLVWLTGLLAIAKSPRHLFPFFAMAGIIVVNGLVHSVAALVTLSYNPGLLSAVVIFLPFYFWILGRSRALRINCKKLITGGLIWAFLAHVIMVGGLLLANWFHIIAEPLYWCVLIFWSVLPIFVMRPRS